MIDEGVEASLHMAFVEARQARHEFITVEHLLLALLDNPSAAEVLRDSQVNIESLRKSLVDFIGDHVPIMPGTAEVDTQPTQGFQRVIQRAIMNVQAASNGREEVTGAYVLDAIFGEKDSHALAFLHQQGVTRVDVANFISHHAREGEQAEPQLATEGVVDVQTVSEQVAAHALASFNQQGALMAWSARITRLAPGECEITVPMSAAVTQQHGYFHGGVIGTIADSAGGYAANTMLMPERECLSAEYKINIVAPGVGDTLIARGKLRKLGKTLVVSSADVFVVKDGVEKLCAIMQQTLFIITGQSS